LEDRTIFSYKYDNCYHPEAEDGVIYNDKYLNIDWKLGEDEIQRLEKDRNLPKIKTIF
jgi:dTDP-4-dehydrorhamnose 3,5-epimerase